MNKNAFIVLGFTGIAVTFLLQMLMLFAFKEDFENWWVFYIVWFVFLIIGITLMLRSKKNSSSK